MTDATPRNFATGDAHLAAPPPKAEGWEASFVRSMTDAQAGLLDKKGSMFKEVAPPVQTAAKETPPTLNTDMGDLYKSVHQQMAA